MNVVEIINEAIASGRTRFAFELLPPLKGDGMQKIFDLCGEPCIGDMR